MSVFSMMDISGSIGSSNGNDSRELKKIYNYLYMLNEQLKYSFENIDPEDNFSDDSLLKYIRNGEDILTLEVTAEKLRVAISDAEGNISELKLTASSLTSRITDAEGNISSLEQTATSLTSRIGDAEGNISILRQTATSLTSRISDAEGNISSLVQTSTSLITRISDAEGNVSNLQQTATSLSTRISNAEGDVSILQQTAASITTRISNAEGDVSSLQQTASSLKTRISNAEGDITAVEQTANRINWLITSGSSASSFTLTSRMASLVAKEINLTGYVTFKSLSTAGSTTIDGSNIKTGSIDTERITSNGKKIISYADSALYLGVSRTAWSKVIIAANEVQLNGYHVDVGTNGADVTIAPSNGRLAFFGGSPTSRKSVSTLSSSASLTETISRLNAVISALSGYGLFNK